MKKAMGLSMVLVKNTGDQSGQPRTVPLLSYPVRDNQYAVVASNGGRDKAPAWLLNLLANPTIAVQVGKNKHQASARPATAEEKAALFPAMTKAYKGWAYYETITDRVIPVILLTW